MKKVCLILCLCIIGLFSASCGADNKEITMESFENYMSTYKNIIQSVDESLVINESSLAAQDGDYIKVYSIETSEHTCYGVTLTVISAKKAKLLVEFNNANEDWSVDNIALFANFISKLSNCELQFSEIVAACNDICQSNNYRFNKNARLFWDDERSTLYYYEEQLTININS